MAYWGCLRQMRLIRYGEDCAVRVEWVYLRDETENSVRVRQCSASWWASLQRMAGAELHQIRVSRGSVAWGFYLRPI